MILYHIWIQIKHNYATSNKLYRYSRAVSIVPTFFIDRKSEWHFGCYTFKLQFIKMCALILFLESGVNETSGIWYSILILGKDYDKLWIYNVVIRFIFMRQVYIMYFLNISNFNIVLRNYKLYFTYNTFIFLVWL